MTLFTSTGLEPIHNRNRLKLIVVFVVLSTICVGPLRGELLTFRLDWSGADFNNSATATAFLVLDDTVFPNPPDGINFFGAFGIVDFEMTVSGASAGNGTFVMADFNSVAFSSNAPLDLNMELLGQAGFGPGVTGTDFNLFSNINSGGPFGTAPFVLETNEGNGDELLITNFTPVPPSNWANPSGGDYDVSGNWDHGVPNRFIEATFGIPDTYGVNLTQDEACRSMEFLDGNVTLTPQTFNLTCETTMVDGGIMNLASGNLTVADPLTSIGINTANLQITAGIATISDSTIVGSGGSISITGGSLETNSFDNLAGGSVDLDGGHFDFGSTSPAEFLSISTVSGSLAGDVNVGGLNDVSDFANFNNAAVDVSEVSISNSGLLFGTEFLDVGLNNQTDGELRTFSDDWVRFAGAENTNAGEINNFGGTVEFTGSLVNEFDGLIGGRGLFIVDGGVTNDGGIAFSGDFADVLGDIDNSMTGIIAIGGNSLTTFFDDVEMLDPMNPDVVVGSDSTAVFFGSYNGGNSGSGTVEIFGDLRPGNSPAAVSFGGDLLIGGSSTTEIEIGGLIAGDEYDQLNVAGDLTLSGSLNVVFIDSFVNGPGQQFTIAQVGGSLIGTFADLPEGTIVPGTDLMVTYAGGDGNDIVLFTDEPVLLGDVNCDGTVNLLDIDPFVDVLASGQYNEKADTNQDGAVNQLDVVPFIAILAGG